MAPTPPTPKCESCGKAWALKKPDPDGGRRCFAHSTDPVRIAERKGLAEMGRASGAMQQGVPPDQRGAVLAGVVPIEQARASKLRDSERRRQAKREIEEIKAVELGSKADVLKFLGHEAGALQAGAEYGRASAAASLAKAALAALGVEEETPAESEVVGFTVEVVDRNTKVN